MDTITLTDYVTPASKYPRMKLGRAEIKSHFWKGEVYEAYHTGPGKEKYAFIRAENRLRMTNLKIDGKVWMVDDPHHWWRIQEHAKEYKGHVLVAGLGLGLIVHALRENPKVSDVTVVERDPDVIKLIRPYIPECRIVEADWYEYEPDHDVDGVFFDLFVGKGEDLWPGAFREMMRLMDRFPGATHRILGFPNDSLIRQAKAVREIQGGLADLRLREKLAAMAVG